MSIAIYCLLFAGLMPVLTVAIAKAQPRYNNRDPRAWLEKQEGVRRRADYAHRNHFEAFPFFAAGILIAMQMKVPQAGIDSLAIGWVIARLAYTVFYLVDQHALRSLSWVAAMACVVMLFLRAAGMAG